MEKFIITYRCGITGSIGTYVVTASDMYEAELDFWNANANNMWADQLLDICRA